MGISACLITKNEEKNIERCIKSFKDVVDEIVVVDTGSSDSTTELAKSLGARVYNFEWKQNFADARNFALNHAKYKWVVFLDADEYFAEGTGSNIPEIIRSIDKTRYDSVYCKIINIDRITNNIIDEASIIRIFRNEKSIRYVNAIHECITKKNSYFVDEDQLVIKHTGYSSDGMQDKLKRNLELLNDMLNSGNENLAYFYLVDCYAGMEQFDTAVVCAKKYINSGMRIEKFHSKVPQYMIVSMIKAGYDKEIILKEIDKWADIFPGHPTFASLKALVCFENKEYSAALECYKNTLKCMKSYNIDEYVKRVYSIEQIYYMMGYICEFKNDYNSAVEYYINSLKENKFFESALNRTINIIKNESPEDIILFFNGLYNRNNEKDVEFLTTALSKFKLGRVLMYYQNIWKNRFGNIDNTFMSMLLSNGEYEDASKYFYQCYTEEINEWTERFTVISAILSNNTGIISQIKNKVNPFYQKIIEYYFSELDDFEFTKDEALIYLSLLYEFILLKCNKQVNELIGLKDRFKVDISPSIGNLLQEYGAYEQAIKQYEDSLKINTLAGKFAAGLHFKIGCCWYKLYNYRRALAEFNDSVQMGYKDNDIIEYLNWIKERPDDPEIDKQAELLLETVLNNQKKKTVLKHMDGNEILKRIECLKNFYGEGLDIDLQRVGKLDNLPDYKVIDEPGTLGTILVTWGKNADKVPFFGEMEKAVQALINREYRVLIVPFKDEDKEICRLLTEKFESPNISAIDNILTLDELIALIDKCSFCLSMEPLTNILSIASNRPILSINGSSKLDKLMIDGGLEPMLINSGEIDGKAIIEKIMYTIENYEDISFKIDNMFDKVKKKSNMDNQMEQYKRQVKGRIEHLIASGNLNDALSLINEYEDIISDDVEIYSMKAVTAIKKDRLYEAEETIKTGLKIDNQNIDLNCYLGYICYSTGRFGQALKYYNIAREFCKDEIKTSEIESIIHDLESMNANYLRNNEQAPDCETIKDDESCCPLYSSDYSSSNLKKVLYLGWIGKGNVGDDLLFEIFKKMLFHLSEDKKHNLIIDSLCPTVGYEIDITQYNLVILGGGSLFTLDGYEKLCQKALEMDVPIMTWGTGIDLRDGETIRKIINAFKDNKPIRANVNSVLDIIDKAEIVSVRGNLDKYILNSDKIQVIGDPGIIFDRLNNKYPEISELNGYQSLQSNLVLINWGTSYNNIAGKNEKLLEEELKKAVNYLLEAGYKIVVYPIWTEDIGSCKEFVSYFKSPDIKCIERVYDVYGLANIISKCSFTINLKLHANILSMAMKKPFISLAYGLKCYDFAESIDSLDLIIPTDEAGFDKIVDKVKYVQRNFIGIEERFTRYIDLYYKKQIDCMHKLVSLIDKV